MPRFFSEKPEKGRLTLRGGDARHAAKALRLRRGDIVTVCDGEGTDYECEVELVKDGEMELVVKSEKPSVSEPKQRVTLFMAVPKHDKMDLIVQKSVELGVNRIVPFISKNCVSRPDSFEKKLERWNRIAAEAAGQCGRGIVPKVHGPVGFDEAIRQAAEHGTGLFFYEFEKEHGIRDVLSEGLGGTVSLVIGPEGGFDPTEAEEAVKAGLKRVSLGPRILRCETAPLAVMAVIMYAGGNMDC